MHFMISESLSKDNNCKKIIDNEVFTLFVSKQVLHTIPLTGCHPVWFSSEG